MLPLKNFKGTNEWTFELIEKFDKIIERIACGKYKLDIFPNQIEIINSEQMLDTLSSIGMPLNYHHWSFGKNLVNLEKDYQRGNLNLAFEIVINSNPCISYLLEENSLLMQILVIAHACYGHNSFFKGNYLFKTWTSPDSIIDYLVFAKKYILDCEEQHGFIEVESFLDSCHALKNFGVDRYQRPNSQIEPEENLLYFFEKKAALLQPWQREIIRIVRKIAQYFYPQRQTKLMNEGWATFWHYKILNDLYDNNDLNNSMFLEFIEHHTNVIYQPGFNNPAFLGINPYALGFNMYQEIIRICTNPTSEDCKFFKDYVNTNPFETLDFAMKNFKDESFIRQFLTPKLIRDFKLFSVIDTSSNDYLVVDAIHNEDGYHQIKENLAEAYNLSSCEPNIQIYSINSSDQTLILRHYVSNERPLDSNTEIVLKHIHKIWGYAVILESVDPINNFVLKTYRCP